MKVEKATAIAASTSAGDAASEAEEDEEMYDESEDAEATRLLNEAARVLRTREHSGSSSSATTMKNGAAGVTTLSPSSLHRRTESPISPVVNTREQSPNGGDEDFFGELKEKMSHIK